MLDQTIETVMERRGKMEDKLRGALEVLTGLGIFSAAVWAEIIHIYTGIATVVTVTCSAFVGLVGVYRILRKRHRDDYGR